MTMGDKWVEPPPPTIFIRPQVPPSAFDLIMKGDFKRLTKDPLYKDYALTPGQWIELISFGLTSRSGHHLEFLCDQGPPPLFHSSLAIIFGMNLISHARPGALELFSSKLGPKLAIEGPEGWPSYRFDRVVESLEETFPLVKDEPHLVFVLQCLLRIDPPLTSQGLTKLFVKACRKEAWTLAFGLVAFGAHQRLSIGLSEEMVYALEEGYEPTIFSFWHLVGKEVYEEGMGETETHLLKDDLFTTACQDGLSAVAHWMVGTGDVDPSLNDYSSFVHACWYDGSLDTAKWLARTYPLSPSSIQRAFEESKGQETQEWLISLGGFRVNPSHPLFHRYLETLVDRWVSMVWIVLWFRRWHRYKCEKWYSPSGIFGLRVVESLVKRRNSVI